MTLNLLPSSSTMFSGLCLLVRVPPDNRTERQLHKGTQGIKRHEAEHDFVVNKLVINSLNSSLTSPSNQLSARQCILTQTAPVTETEPQVPKTRSNKVEESMAADVNSDNVVADGLGLPQPSGLWAVRYALQETTSLPAACNQKPAGSRHRICFGTDARRW